MQADSSSSPAAMSRQHGGEARDTQYPSRAPAGDRRTETSRRDDQPYRDEYPPPAPAPPSGAPNDYYPDDAGRGDVTSRRQRDQRAPADAEYWDERRDRDERRDGRDDRREDRGDRSRGPGPQYSGYPPPREAVADQYGNNSADVEVKLMKAEMDELVNQLETMRRENEAMHQRVDDARKELEQKDRDCEELREMCRKMGEAGGSDDRQTSSADVDKLKAELDKKSRLVDKLMGDQREGEKAVYEEMQTELQALLKENDKLKKAKYSGSRGDDGAEPMDRMASTLKAKDQLINEINEEKEELLNLLEEDGAKEKYMMMKEKYRALKKTISELREQNERLEAEVAELRPGRGACELTECDDKCKKNASSCEWKKESRKKVGVGKGDAMQAGTAAGGGKNLQPLQDLVREQESHIIDLQREVDTLRHAINDYQKELERIDPHGRGAMTDDQALRLFPSLKTEREDAEDMHRELDQSRRKLRSSNRRVAQLEKWLDEIYNDKNLEIVVKGSTFKGRRTTLSLPEIQGASGGGGGGGGGDPAATTRSKGPPLRRQYVLAKSGRDSARKTNRSNFYH